ncbi:MAG: hypothetical protein ACKVPX_11245 [Myxococcaceae bacterium]
MKPRVQSLVVSALGCCMFLACTDPPPDVDTEEEEAVCYDTADNDSDDAADCADSGCEGLVPCCVSRAEGCCVAKTSLFSRDFGACTSVTVDKCAPEVALYGSPLLTDGALAPTGVAGENGVYFRAPLDPVGANLRIVFEGARASECSGSCLNYVSIGLTDRPPTPSDFRAYYNVAVTLLPAFGTLQIRSPWDATMAAFPIDAGFHRYAMDITTNGRLTLSEIDSTGATLTTLASDVSVVLNDPAYLAISGQRENMPPGVTPSRVRSVSVERGRCDRPQASRQEAAAVIPASGTPEVSSLSDIDGVGRAVNAAGLELVVVDVDGAFHEFRKVSGTYRPVGSLATPALSTAAIPLSGVTRIADPWLVADEAAGRWQLYFTMWTSARNASIARVSSLPSFSNTFDLSTFAVVADPAVGGGVDAYEMPTVLGDLMIVRVKGGDLAFFVRLERTETGWIASEGGVLEGEIHRAGVSIPGALDRDEIADPALVFEGGSYRLYYAARRGTRWGMALLMSEGGRQWHKPLGEAPVWERDEASFASLAVRDPAPWVNDGQVELLFRGGNLLEYRVGRATSGSRRTLSP